MSIVAVSREKERKQACSDHLYLSLDIIDHWIREYTGEKKRKENQLSNYDRVLFPSHISFFLLEGEWIVNRE